MSPGPSAKNERAGVSFLIRNVLIDEFLMDKLN
jgi:hypothetical protein